MYFWLSFLLAAMFVAILLVWLAKQRAQKKIDILQSKYTDLQAEFDSIAAKSLDYENQYKKLKEHSVERVKDLRTELFKVQHRETVAKDSYQKLSLQNENISHKITQLYNKKEAQISDLESKINDLKRHVDLPTTSQEQIDMVKNTISRLDNILKEEHEFTDQQLLLLEKRLKKLEPIDFSIEKTAVGTETFYEDDLTEIVGIGSKLANILRDYGIYTFRQLAELDESQISDISHMLGEFGDRIVRDKWIEQARYLDKFRH